MSSKSINISDIKNLHRFSHKAMATFFEIIIQHDDANYARQAADDAFIEIDQLEKELSRFIENSDISRINSLKAGESTVVGLDAYECIRQCKHVQKLTNGAFDITVGELMHAWLNPDKSLRQPSDAEFQAAFQKIGLDKIIQNDDSFEITTTIDEIHLDLGGYGKGYTIDKSAEILEDWDIERFFIHGGKSSVYASLPPEELEGWPISVSNPFNNYETVEKIHIKNQAMGASGMQKGMHIINPRNGQPCAAEYATWVFAPNASLADALSTAFIIMSVEEIEQFCKTYPDVKVILIHDAQNNSVQKIGKWD